MAESSKPEQSEESKPEDTEELKSQQTVLLTREQLSEYKKAFNLFDKDGNGQITSKELGNLMNSIGEKPTDAQLQNLINEVDLDGSGSLNFEEFLQIVARPKTKEETMNEIREAFRIFDEDKDGFISVEELRKILTTYGNNIDDKEVDELMRAADVDCDGRLNYEEFINMMMEK